MLDVIDADGAPALVMELLEGQSLRERLDRQGALGVRLLPAHHGGVGAVLMHRPERHVPGRAGGRAGGRDGNLRCSRVMRWPRIPAILVVVSIVLSPAVALANDVLVVRRANEATDCPRTEMLAEMVRRLTPRGPTAAPAGGAGDRIEVDFARDASRYRANLRMSGTREGSRALEYPSSTCRAMAEAVALTIAVLVDPDFVPPDDTKPSDDTEPPTAPPPAAPQPPSADAKPALERGSWDTSLLFGGGLTAGVVSNAAPVFVLGGGLAVGRFSVHLTGMGVPPQHFDVSPGAVDVWFAAASLTGCFSPLRASSWQVGGCTGVSGGALRGSGSGVRDASDALRPWLAADVHVLALGSFRGAIGWFARIGAVVPFERASFAIAGAGIAYEPMPIAFVGAIGPALTFR